MAIIALFALLIGVAWGIRPGTFARPPVFSRNRRQNPLVKRSLVATYEFTTPHVIVTVDSAFVLGGIPQILTNTGKLPISATWISALSFKVTYDTPGAVTSVTVQEGDPGVKSATGGSLAPGTFLAP